VTGGPSRRPCECGSRAKRGAILSCCGYLNMTLLAEQKKELLRLAA
jgi:hypothetical protein